MRKLRIVALGVVAAVMGGVLFQLPANALDVTWGDGPLKGQSNDTIQATLKASIVPLALPPLGALTVEGEFTFAPATHAPLEVECAISLPSSESKFGLVV